MPRLIVHSMAPDIIQAAHRPLFDRLQALLATSREYLVLEVSGNKVFLEEGTGSGHPFVEVRLFPRGDQLEDSIAKIVNDTFKEAGSEAPDVAITYFQRERYYEDGIRIS